MKINVGDVVRNAVYSQNKKSITEIAKEIGHSRVYTSKFLANDLMFKKHVLAIGKALNVDFSRNFKELADSKELFILHDTEEIYQSNILLRDKYEELLEEHKELQNKYTALIVKYMEDTKKM
jgi:hypothetical protein